MPKFDRKSLLTYAPFAAALVILVVSCFVQGSWSERWGNFPELQIYARRLGQIPLEFGEWKGEAAEATDEKILKIAGAEGEFVCVYQNASGQSVRVSIICARLRDVFHHTPDRCYPAAGFEMTSEPKPEVFEIGNTTAEFFTTTFLKSEPTGTHSERGFWSWSADGKWIAPKNPKLKFAGEKALYKLYVFAAVPPGIKKAASRDDYCANFIRAFIPVLEQSLRPSAADNAPQVSKDTAPAKPAA
jgi:hypothetical protein